MGYNDQLNKKPEHNFNKLFKSKKLLIIGAVVVVLLLSVGIGSWIYVTNQRTLVDETVIKQEKAATQAFETKQALDTKAYNGDVEGALSGYDKAIASTTDEVSKRNLLIDKAIVALNKNLLKESLGAIQAADKIKSDFNTLGLIATVYDKMGDTKNAIEFYQKAINSKGESNLEKPLYEARVAELQGNIK